MLFWLVIMYIEDISAKKNILTSHRPTYIESILVLGSNLIVTTVYYFVQ